MDKKEERRKVITEIRRGARLAYNLFVWIGISGLCIGLILLFRSLTDGNVALLPSSISLTVISVILLVFCYPIEAIILGFAQLVENSNICAFRENPDDPEM